MVTHLSEVIRQHAFELITRQEVVRLVENLKKTAPELVEEAFPQLISYSFFQRVLTGLLKENVPIRDLETIVETLLSSVSETGLMPRDTDGVIERIRTALKRTITRMYCEDGTMKVLTWMRNWSGYVSASQREKTVLPGPGPGYITEHHPPAGRAA